MSQRVNIQYSIDLEELPEEVERLIVKFGSEIERTAELYHEFPGDPISVSGLQEVENLRMSLAKADHILDDVTKIVTGYIRMNTEPQTREPTQEQQFQQPNPFMPTADSLGSLEEKLKEFAERTRNEQPSEVSDNQ